MKGQKAKISIETAVFPPQIWKLFINSLTLRRNLHGEDSEHQTV